MLHSVRLVLARLLAGLVREPFVRARGLRPWNDKKLNSAELIGGGGATTLNQPNLKKKLLPVSPSRDGRHPLATSSKEGEHPINDELFN